MIVSRLDSAGMELPKGLHAANEGLAFLFELLALVALGWWGFTVGAPVGVRVVLGVGTPLVAIVLWGLFAAPRARFRVGIPAVLAVKVLVFGAATVALFAMGKPVLAIVFAVLVVINTALATVDRNAAVVRSRAE